MFELLIVMASGALGCGARFLVGRVITNHSAQIGLATWTVNIIGCLLIGMIWSYLTKNGLEQSSVKLILLVGFLGGFTTFSAFSLDTILLLQNGLVGSALINIFLQPLIGAAATYAGIRLVS